MLRLSVVIIARDEERTIGQVIEACQPIASEIILVDSGSKDNTLTIAGNLGCKIYHQDWLGYAAQKNYAMSLASGDWILSLDADEVLTPSLVSEIKIVLSDVEAGRRQELGFKIPRVLYIGNTAIKHGGFYPDAQLRLIKKGQGEFNDRLVHEAIKMTGPVGTLNNYFKHYSYRDVQGFQDAMEKYARLYVKETLRTKAPQGWKVSKLNEVVHPAWTFFYRYIVRAGFMDGFLGLQLSSIYSDYVRRKIKYLRDSVKEA